LIRRAKKILVRNLLIFCLVFLTGTINAGENAAWKSEAPISIPYLSNRPYVSSMSIMQKLGDFAGYRSYAVEYESDGLKLRAVMNTPVSEMPPEGYPVLIMNHGFAGGREEQFKRYYSSDQDSDSYRKLIQGNPLVRYAREGFVVFQPDYRGHGYSENHGKHDGAWQLDRFGNKAVNKAGKNVPRVLDDDGLRFNGWLYTAYYTIDVLNLVAALTSFDEFPEGIRLDQENLFAWGRSLGGDVTARLMTCTDKVKAASLWVPATTSLWDQAHHYHYDSPLYADSISMENLLVELQTYNKVHATHLVTRDLIPNNFIDQVRGPFMIQVSLDDKGVRSAWGIEYYYELQEYGVDTELRVYPGNDHVFQGEILEQAILEDLRFFRSQISR
jgi:dipeptidyl aminopeptidase/acylaminoacyl peptidase